MKALVFFAVASLAAAIFGSDAQALTAQPAGIEKAADGEVEASDQDYRPQRHYRGPSFSNWCAYNCYSVPRCSQGCYGAYGYSRYAYDEDMPFPYRCDPEASPLDHIYAVIKQ